MKGEIWAFFGIQAVSPIKTVEAASGSFRAGLRPVSGGALPVPILEGCGIAAAFPL